MRHPQLIRTLVGLVSLCVVETGLGGHAAYACAGDCDDNGEVAINELVIAVNIALGTFDIAVCLQADGNADGQVTINDLVASVNNALSGCPTPTPTPTGESTVTATATLGVTPPTSSPTAADTPAATTIPTATPTAVNSPTGSPMVSATATATSPSTATIPVTATPTGSRTASRTATVTSPPTAAVTASPTRTMTAAATSTATRTATVTRTGTRTRTPTRTATAGGTPATATPTASATPVPVPSGVVARTCRMLAGNSQATLQAKNGRVVADLTGSQVWRIDAAQANGTRQIVSLPSESHFDCGLTSIGSFRAAGCLRMDPARPAQGMIDCAGGQVGGGYDVVASVDHNTNQNAMGFPQDASCANTVANPDGSIAAPCIEGVGADCAGARSVHVGVCNSAVNLGQSGGFPAGGLHMTQHLLMRIVPNAACAPGVCPSDGAPFDAAAGDLRVTAQLTSGSAKGVIFNLDNNPALTLGTTGSGDGPSICGFGGDEECVTSAAGAPYTALCANVPAGSLHTGRLVAALTALDLPAPIYDVIATIGITCE